jgi:chromosome segregation ATPase
MMGKKALIRELEAALSQTLSDRAIERQRHAMVVNAMTAGMQRLTEERDELRLELAGMTSDAALDAAMADIETLTQANEEADATIGELRDDLADMRERLDAALTEAARMRKEWTGDVTAAREIIERKSAEIVELRRDVAALRRDYDTAILSWSGTESLLQERERELDALQEQHAGMSDARDDLLESLARANALIGNIRFQRDGLRGRCTALSDELDALKAAQAQQQEHASQWGALCFRLRNQASHIDAVVQAAQAEPVVTLEAIEELELGEQLIDEDGATIERVPGGYGVSVKFGVPNLRPDAQSALECYQEVKNFPL